MNCTACGQELPAEASFCWRCGKPVASAQNADGWEYRDFSAPFPPNVTPWRSLTTSRPQAYDHPPVRVFRLIDRAVASLTQQARTQGWEPAEATDAMSLWKAHRVEFATRPRNPLWALMILQANYDLILVRVSVSFRRHLGA